MERETNSPREVQDNQGTIPSVQSLTKDFCDNTTAHGLKRIASAKHWTQTALWSLLFIGAVTMLCYQTYKLVDKFCDRPLSTLVTVKTENSLHFPVVTLCNFNAIKSSWLEEHGDESLKEVALYYANSSIMGTALSNRIRRRPGKLATSSTGHGSVFSDDNFEDSSEKELHFQTSEQFFVLLSKEKETTLAKAGHKFEDMVLSCTFRGISCQNYSAWFWDHFWHYKYGNCFVFNSGRTKSGGDVPLIQSNKPGPSDGLILVLDIEQDEYITNITQEAGIRVDITTQGETPFPLEKGVSLAPGFATMIGLRKVVIERKDPFGKYRCFPRNNSDEDHLSLYKGKYNTNYSAMACKESCLASHQMHRCQCQEYRFPVDNHPVCSTKNRTQVKCVNTVQLMFKNNQLNCSKSCPPPCNQVAFMKSSSFSIWPSETNKGSNVAVASDLGKSVVKLQVFLEELDVQEIREQLSYELAAFVSDLGGQLGLWIGFSVLTLAEFLEFLMLLGRRVLQKLAEARKVTPYRWKLKKNNDKNADINT